MGKSGFSSHVEAEAHVIVHQSRTRDEAKGSISNSVARDDLSGLSNQLVIGNPTASYLDR